MLSFGGLCLMAENYQMNLSTAIVGALSGCTCLPPGGDGDEA